MLENDEFLVLSEKCLPRYGLGKIVKVHKILSDTQTVVYDPFNAFYCYTMPNIFLSKLSPSQHAYVKYTTAIKLLQKEKIKLDNKIKAAQEEFFKFHEDNDGYLKFLN